MPVIIPEGVLLYGVSYPGGTTGISILTYMYTVPSFPLLPPPLSLLSPSLLLSSSLPLTSSLLSRRRKPPPLFCSITG